MPIELKVPVIGESVSEIFIGQWYKGEGSTVAVDENLVELESEKATLDVPSPSAGVARPARMALATQSLGYTEARSDHVSATNIEPTDNFGRPCSIASSSTLLSCRLTPSPSSPWTCTTPRETSTITTNPSASPSLPIRIVTPLSSQKMLV